MRWLISTKKVGAGTFSTFSLQQNEIASSDPSDCLPDQAFDSPSKIVTPYLIFPITFSLFFRTGSYFKRRSTETIRFFSVPDFGRRGPDCGPILFFVRSSMPVFHLACAPRPQKWNGVHENSPFVTSTEVDASFRIPAITRLYASDY